MHPSSSHNFHNMVNLISQLHNIIKCLYHYSCFWLYFTLLHFFLNRGPNMIYILWRLICLVSLVNYWFFLSSLFSPYFSFFFWRNWVINPLNERSARLFYFSYCKGPVSKYFRFCGICSLCCGICSLCYKYLCLWLPSVAWEQP